MEEIANAVVVFIHGLSLSTNANTPEFLFIFFSEYCSHLNVHFEIKQEMCYWNEVLRSVFLQNLHKGEQQRK